MKYIAALGLAVLLLAGCSTQPPTNTPECIKPSLDAYQAQASCGKKATLELWKFQGDYVYLLNLLPCVADGAIDVIDKNCDQLGFLGGLPGNRMVNGEDFFKNATKLKVLWEGAVGVRSGMQQDMDETLNHDHNGDGQPDH